MLTNLALAHYHFGRGPQAMPACHRALELRSDHSTYQHQLWVAFEEAVNGRWPRAAFLLQEAQNAEMAVFFQTVREITKAVLKVAQAPPEQRRRVFADERKRLGHTKAIEPGLRGTVGRYLRRRAYAYLAELCGVWNNPLWRYQRISFNLPKVHPAFLIWFALALASILRTCAYDPPPPAPRYHAPTTPARVRQPARPTPSPLTPPNSH